MTTPFTAYLTAVLPSMLDQGRGHIVVISSLQGKIGLPQRSSCECPAGVAAADTAHCDLYPLVDCASKHALQGYFDSLRVELAPRGVSVTVVSPGYISTQLSANAVRGDGSKHGGE